MLHQTMTPAPVTMVTSMCTKQEREQLLADVRVALTPLGVTLEITPYSDRHFVVLATGNDLKASFDFDGLDPDPSMIHWHMAKEPLAPVPGAWVEKDINPSHRRKATSFPESFVGFVEVLVAGFAAAADGSAFRS